MIFSCVLHMLTTSWTGVFHGYMVVQESLYMVARVVIKTALRLASSTVQGVHSDRPVWS